MVDLNPTIYYTKVDQKESKSFVNVCPSFVRSRLGKFVIVTRILLFIFQLIFNRRDYSTDAFKGIVLPPEEYTYLDGLIRTYFRGFSQWDAAHMLHIAEHGYVLESSLAFYPLFPLTVRYLSYWAFPLIYFKIVHVSSIHLLTAWVLNLILFYKCSILMFECVENITQSVKQAHIALILFAVNPASIFFSSAYSESMYNLLTIRGINSLVKRDGNFWAKYFSSLVFFAFACFTRSNGLLNFGYIGFYCALNAFFVDVEGSNKTGGKMLLIYKDVNTIISQIILLLAQLTIALFTITSLVTVHGAYQQHIFCSKETLNSVPKELVNLAVSSDASVAGEIDKLSWCTKSNLILPSFYSAIQAKYWNVSLFGYWQIQKIPCFIIAMPAIAIIIYGIAVTVEDIKRITFMQYLVNGGELIPYMLHSAFLGLGAVFIYNTEVLTRMLFSSSPFAYIVIARWMSDITPRVYQSDLLEPAHMPFLAHFAHRGNFECLVFVYFIGFYVLGTTCHVMGLPFT